MMTLMKLALVWYLMPFFIFLGLLIFVVAIYALIFAVGAYATIKRKLWRKL